jgi:hypothetical protein
LPRFEERKLTLTRETGTSNYTWQDLREEVEERLSIGKTKGQKKLREKNAGYLLCYNSEDIGSNGKPINHYKFMRDTEQIKDGSKLIIFRSPKFIVDQLFKDVHYKPANRQKFDADLTEKQKIEQLISGNFGSQDKLKSYTMITFHETKQDERDPPKNYICHKCGCPATDLKIRHWIHDCPFTYGIKAARGIPRCFLDKIANNLKEAVTYQRNNPEISIYRLSNGEGFAINTEM